MTQTAPAVQTPPNSAQKKLTRYHVLVEITGKEGGSTYESFAANVPAANDKAAIKDAANGKPGVYVAIPSRSFKPVTVKVEQTTKITLTQPLLHAVEQAERVSVSELIGMPWDDYIHELAQGERIWRDAESIRGLKAMRLAPTLAVYNALIAGQPVPDDALDQKWLRLYR